MNFSVLSARPEPHAVVPTLTFQLSLESELQVQALALRCQIQIEPRRRAYQPREQERLLDLFGEPPRWSQTLGNFLWTHASTQVGAFRGKTEVDLPVACSYDFEVNAASYFKALEEGEIPLLFLFSGSIFARSRQGLSVTPIPWDREARFRLPVSIWQALMDRYFPEAGWIRLSRVSLNALQTIKSRHGLMSWDDTIAALLGERVG